MVRAISLCCIKGLRSLLAVSVVGACLTLKNVGYANINNGACLSAVTAVQWPSIKFWVPRNNVLKGGMIIQYANEK